MAANSATVATSGALTAADGQVYLAAVSTKPYRTVYSVSGLGLTWSPIGDQCSARGQTGVAVWAAHGFPTGDAPVVVDLEQAATSSAVAVSRYSGVDLLAPIGSARSVNTNGVDGACTGGTDSARYAFQLATPPGSLAYAAASMRTKTHTPGVGFTERVELVQGSGGSAASLAVEDATSLKVRRRSVEGRFSAVVDWAVVAVVLRPVGTTLPAPNLVVLPGTYHYGTLAAGMSAAHTFVLHNTGNLDLELANIRLLGSDAAAFRLPPPPAVLTLSPGESLDLEVAFEPLVEGGKTATMRIDSNDPDQPELDVTLTGQAVLVAGTGAMWISAVELAQKPMSGPAWGALLEAADGDLGTPDVAAFGSKHDVRTLAVALVWARTGSTSYRQKARDAIVSAIGTEVGTTQAVQPGRNTVCYVLSADLIDLAQFDPAADALFRDWIDALRFVVWPDGSIVAEDEERANNHGRMCGMTRAAIAIYLGDVPELERTAQVFRGFLGDRDTYDEFLWNHDLSWQSDLVRPVGINPVGATRQGLSIDGALPEEMRRGGPFQIPPVHTGYPWEALQGTLVEAVLLDRAGYDVFQWEDQAILRAVQFLDDLQTQFPGDPWWAEGDDTWSPWVVNAMYGSSFPTEAAAIGKCMGWTDWTHAP